MTDAVTEIGTVDVRVRVGGNESVIDDAVGERVCERAALCSRFVIVIEFSEESDGDVVRVRRNV